MPKKVPIKVDMTSPGSKLRYKITYPSGQEKWVHDRPGHKSDRWKLREKKLLLREPAIKQFLGRLEYVVNSYLDGEKEESDIQQVVRNFEISVGWNRARMVVRRVRRNERKKLREMKGDEEEHQQKIVDALQVAVDYSARRRRDKKKKAGETPFDTMARVWKEWKNAYYEATSKLPDGTVIGGWKKITIVGDAFWQKGHQTKTYIVEEAGQKATDAVLERYRLVPRFEREARIASRIWVGSITSKVADDTKMIFDEKREGPRIAKGFNQSGSADDN